MTNKKNKFFAFCFSLIPGAGEMYLGFYKMGISLMSIFWMLVALSGILDSGIFIFLLPVIWFYSFFHVHNLNGLPDEEFYALQDTWILPLQSENASVDSWIKRYKKPLAIVLMLLGLSLLWNIIIDLIYQFMGLFAIFDEFYSLINTLSHAIPQFIIALIIIGAGIHLIRNKKDSLDQD